MDKNTIPARKSILANQIRKYSDPDYMRVSFIYGLYDPKRKKYFYVGVTIRSLAIRLREHISTALRLKGKKKKCDIICKLVANGIKPEIHLLKKCKGYHDPMVSEKKITQKLRVQRHPIVTTFRYQ